MSAPANIVAEARAYVEAYSDSPSWGEHDCGRYLVGLLAAFDAQAAEITQLRAPPGADVQALAQWMRDHWDRGEAATTITTEEWAGALQAYGDERAREATEAERRRCATIDGIDIDRVRREARAAAIEEAAQAVTTITLHSSGRHAFPEAEMDMFKRGILYAARAIRALAAGSER